MPVGVRHLTVLGEFKPFGLIAEALEGGKPPENAHDRYHYFLFDPEIAHERDGDVGCDFLHSGNHELFIRGNRRQTGDEVPCESFASADAATGPAASIPLSFLLFFHHGSQSV
ncbi:Anaphase-promoting complex subunit 1 [Asimina triloba]